GRVAVGGGIGSLLELGAGFHPDLTGRENVYLNGSIHGLRRAAIREKLDEIVTFAGLEEFIDLPVRTYSSGMYMRLGFAIASHIEADVLLLDEVFAVGGEVARCGRVRLLGPDGDERSQLLGGEPFAIALDVLSDRTLPPPRLGWELRDDAGILVASGAASTSELGWDDDSRSLPLRFDAERPPFADGRLHLRLDLSDERGESQYHSIDDALVFVVYPADGDRGPGRPEGEAAAGVGHA